MKIASIKDEKLYVEELIEGENTSFSEGGLITGELTEHNGGVSFTESNVYVKELIEDDMPPIQDGLVLWYDFKDRTNSEPNRGIAFDRSGNGNHGTLQNFSFENGSGYQDGGLVFDGVDDYVRSYLSNAIAAGSPLTIEFVINIHKKSTETGRQNLLPYLYFHPNGHLYYHYTSRYLIRNTEYTAGRTYAMTVVTNGTVEGMFAYLNGLPANSGAGSAGQSAGISSCLISNSDFPLYAGIKSLRILNRALTPSEIAFNYQVDKQRFNLP